jgi:hypothetical protein
VNFMLIVFYANNLSISQRMLKETLDSLHFDDFSFFILMNSILFQYS